LRDELKENRVLLFAFAFFFGLSPANAQPAKPKLTDAKVLTADHVYKKTAEGELSLHCFLPADWKATDNRPVIVFFFGGGCRSSPTLATP